MSLKTKDEVDAFIVGETRKGVLAFVETLDFE